MFRFRDEGSPLQDSPGLPRHLTRRASAFEGGTEGSLYLSGLHLGARPWPHVTEVDVVREVPFETGLVAVNEMLARLQELTWEQESRDTIEKALSRIKEIFDPLELEWLISPSTALTTWR